MALICAFFIEKTNTFAPQILKKKSWTMARVIDREKY